jgi:hypothetical protein
MSSDEMVGRRGAGDFEHIGVGRRVRQGQGALTRRSSIGDERIKNAIR